MRSKGRGKIVSAVCRFGNLMDSVLQKGGGFLVLSRIPGPVLSEGPHSHLPHILQPTLMLNWGSSIFQEPAEYAKEGEAGYS